jgi:hypothetical protein
MHYGAMIEGRAPRKQKQKQRQTLRRGKEGERIIVGGKEARYDCRARRKA